MSATLASLAEGSDVELVGAADCGRTPIDELCYDSRAVAPGALFAALRGHATDGHRFVPAAIAAGARALLVEERDPAWPEIPTAVAADSRRALASFAANFFAHPSHTLDVIGVTGTNGKTSTVRMIEAILLAAGRAAGSIGTISVRFGGREEASALTTPESVDLQRTLARMRDAGASAVALEVSSHSLALGRVRGLRFAVGVFTHLSQDHLDFHESLDAYGAAKAKLFEPDLLAGTAVLNVRDPWSHKIARAVRDAGRPVLFYGRGPDGDPDVYTEDEEPGLLAAGFRLVTPAGKLDVRLPLPGDFQIENALAAAAAALALDVPLADVGKGLAACPPVPGRLEPVAAERADAPAVFVDYAHTPDALDRVLARVRPFVRGRLVCVFGCGGDRDASKRAPMARAACAHADLVIATSDNPRTEDPDAILGDVAHGLTGDYEIEPDRRSAIRRAVALAGPDDVVVIAGKGHEDYQIVGRERRAFDDRVEARAALEARS